MSRSSQSASDGQKPSVLRFVYDDFILSRKAMLCTKSTIKWYQKMLGKFIDWLEEQDIQTLEEIDAPTIRAFIAMKSEGHADSYVHSFARVIRTFMRFLYAEKHVSTSVTFDMPRVGDRHLRVLSVEEVKRLLEAAGQIRDKAMIYFLADTGVRRSEFCKLNWGDVDFPTGLCNVIQGKGKRDRSIVIGAKTRRWLMRYRKTLENSSPDMPLFQTIHGTRFKPNGIRSALLRLAEKADVPDVSIHALRRTFAVLSLQGGMNLAAVQALMGHACPDMTLHYARLVDDDLLEAHQQYGPVDNML
jgi:site-specific recombinase XerD